MSSILKALRKIEEEKRAAEHSAPDLRVDQGLVSRKNTPFLPIFAGAILGTVLVGLFFLWSTKSQAPDSQVSFAPKPDLVLSGNAQADKIINSGQGEGAPAPAAPESNSLQPITLATRTLEPFHEAGKVTTVVLSHEPVAAASVKARALKSIPQKPPVQNNQQASPPPVAVTEKPLALDTSVLPDGLTLKVTEIFYQDDSANSMAVVNDLPVMVGTQVDSAVVSEIHLDRVTFKVGEKTFSVVGAKP